MAQNKERRNHLTFQEKLIILKERQDTPSKPVRQIVADVLIKHKIKTSRA